MPSDLAGNQSKRDVFGEKSFDFSCRDIGGALQVCDGGSGCRRKPWTAAFCFKKLFDRLRRNTEDRGNKRDAVEVCSAPILRQ